MSKILIEVEIAGISGFKSTAVARCEQLLTASLVKTPFVKSAVVLRDTNPSHPLGWRRLQADESTREKS